MSIFDHDLVWLDGHPILQKAVSDCATIFQVPFQMALASSLAAAAIAVQSKYDVDIPSGIVSPLSLCIMVAAESGERKSTTLSYFFKKVREKQAEFKLANSKVVDEVKGEKKIWSTIEKALNGALSKAVISGADGEKEKEALARHLRNEPQFPTAPQMLYENVTTAALMEGLAGDPRSAGLVSAEAGIVLNGNFSAAMGHINSIWSGDPVTQHRKEGGEVVVEGARLSVLLMAQPEVIERFVTKGEGNAIENGFLPRFLFFYPPSLQGTRGLQFSGGVASSQARRNFESRIGELLDSQPPFIKGRAVERTMVKFSEGAIYEWRNYYNTCEANIKSGGTYSRAGGHASKLAENAARLAAVMHCFEGFEGPITKTTFLRAMSICNLASNSYMSGIVEGRLTTSDAKSVLEWVKNTKLSAKYHRSAWVSMKNLSQNGPKRIRKQEVRDIVLKQLADAGLVSELRDPMSGELMLNFQLSGEPLR